MKTKTFVFILHFAHLIVPLQMMTEMHFENLTIGYQLGRKNEKVVARGLSATLKGGQLTCLLGRNGTGKSTLLRTLAERWRGVVAVVLTDPLDVRNLTAEEVVALGRTPYTNFWGTLRQDDKAAVAEAMQLVGITALAQHDIATLSDGERQKVMMAKALAQQTPVIILDEPTAFLDYPSKQEVMALLQMLAHEQGKAVLLSTHDVELAEQYADQIWFMSCPTPHDENKDGSHLLTGTAQELNIRQLF
jgi:iron complex transport system ATP-binding protein